MELEALRERLAKASLSKSLRELAKEMNVSHETIRKLLNGSDSITLASYNKIEKGLVDNEF